MAIFTGSASDGSRRRIITDNVKVKDRGTAPKETSSTAQIQNHEGLNRRSPGTKEISVRAEMKRPGSPWRRSDGNDKNGHSSSSGLEEHREVLTSGCKKRRLTARSYRAYLNGKLARTESPDAGRIFPKMMNGEGEKTEADCLQGEDVEITKLAESTLNNATSSSYQENQFSSRCSTCSMLQRENNDLQARILCSCNANVGQGLSTSSEEGELETSGGNLTLTNLKDSSEAILRDDHHIICVICKLPGSLVLCGGKGCKAGYHLACLDPPKSDVPPGLWLCFCCLRKKMEFGVHSVSKGIESICDSKEEMQKEKHYLVKYKGLSHVHNRWIPESQLLHKDAVLLAKFNRKHQKEKVKNWKLEWTEPHRLLQKRFLMPPEQVNECSCGHGDNFEYCYLEWFVKWRGLGYEHATWEFENSPFLCSGEGKGLINDYERRREEAKKASDPSRAGKERIVKSILFILKLLPYTCGQFLIISTTSCISTWEAELLRLAPSINVVVYSGNRNVRKMIRALEFYEEGGCIMFQVLLACPNDIVEDFDAFDCVKWEAIIIDDCQKSGVSKHLERFTNLVSEFRLLLLNSLPKDNIVDYLKLLSVLEPSGGEHSVNSLKLDSVDGGDALSILKDRLAQYVVYERKRNSLIFVEYWVPILLSEVQLKQYCNILASNSLLLRSRSRTDCVQSLLDVLISIRKCCDHPYLDDASLECLLTKSLPVAEYLDIGVNASAKLQFLYKFLLEMKNRSLKVLILFQSNVGSERNRMGDILYDFLLKKFGDESFVYVDSRIDMSQSQAILQSFNEMGRDKFVIVIENRACRPRIKLSSVDVVIIYDSDWNPSNDLKALQKITIESPVQQVKVFRLYSPYTVEEKVLMIAKENGGLEVDIVNTSTRLRHSLLSWGAAHLFGKHNEFCKSDSSNTLPQPFIDNLLLNAVVDLLTHSPENVDVTVAGNCSNISKAHLSGASYSRNIFLYGEKDLSSVDGDSTHFWSKLLETSSSSPKFRYTSGASPRVRRAVQFLDEFAKNPQTENYDLKKGRKLCSSTTELISEETWLQCKGQEAQGLGETAASDHTGNANQRTLTQTSVKSVADGVHSKKSEIYNFVGEPIEREKLLDEQKKLHDLWKREMLQLCETLRFPENVMDTAEMFLEYILKNHYVCREPKSMLQAFILSLCWCAAFFSKHDMNHNMSLEFAKKYFNFECNTRQVEAIYEKLKLMEDRFSSLMGVSTNIVNLNPPNNQLHEKKTGDAEVLTLNGNFKMTSEDQDVEAGEVKEHSFCASRKELSCMKKVHQLDFSKDRTVGSSNSTSPNLQKIVGGQTSVPRNDVPKEFLQEGSGEVAAPDHPEPEQGKSQPVVPSNDVAENLIGGVGSETLLFDYEEGEIREDRSIQAHAECKKKLQLLKDELLKRRICLIDMIYSARLDALISKQIQESTEFKNQMNQEEQNLVRTHGLDLEMIRAANTDLEVNDDMKKLQQEFSRKIDRFGQHVRSQRKKLLVMQIEARNKEKKIKDQWLEEAKSGRLVESFDMLPLSTTRFRLEKFREQVEAHDDSGNACSPGSSDAITIPVGSIDLSRSNAIQVTVPNEGMKQTSSEKETSIGNSKTLIAVESSDQSRIIFDVSTTSLSRFQGDELLQNKTSSSQSGKAMGSAESAEKNRIISDIFPANLSGGPADRLVQMMLPVSQCNISLETAVDSTERSSEIPAIIPREEMEHILAKESPACQTGSVTAVEPNRTPPDISETVPWGGPGDKPLEPEALVFQPKILNITCDDHDGVDIISGTLAGHQGGAETNGACLKSSLPSQNNNASSVHALISAGSENSELQDQISSVIELEIPVVSGSEPACSPPRSIVISVLDSGDQELIRVENSDQIPEASHPVSQQQPPSANLTSVSASHERADAHTESGQEPLNQVHCSDQVKGVSTLAPAAETEIGRSSNFLSQSGTLPLLPIPIINHENVHHRHLRIATIRQETVNHLQQAHCSNPLQFEMVRLGEEEKSLAQRLVGKKRDLEVECEKELENVRKKYAALIQGEKTLLTQKMKEIKKIQSLVEMNKNFAEEFRGTFFGNKQGTSAVSQGGPSSFSQQFVRSPRPSSFPQQFIRSPRPEVAQRLVLASSSTRPPAPKPPLVCPPRLPPAFSTGTSVPTFQPILNSSAIFSNNLVWSHINTVPPHMNPVQPRMNLHVRSEPRAPAPHLLRPFRSRQMS